MNANIRRSLPWTLFILLQLFCLYMITHHAMWRDEMQTWSMVRESRSLAELFYNMRFDGMPPLWYLLLWLLSHLSTAPLAMQLFHFLIASAAATILMARAPFDPWTRLCFVAGYYLSFEYMVISRGYSCGVLLAFIYCATAAQRCQRPVLTGTLLGLLANTTVYGAILALSLLAGYGWDLFTAATGRMNRSAVRNLVTTALCFIPLLVVAVAFMIPAKGGNYVAVWNTSPTVTDILTAMSRIALSIAPVPLAGLHFWNSHITDGHIMLVPLLAALSVMLLASMVLWQSKKELMLFLLCFLGILIFSVVIYLGFYRHNGTVMICFTVACWLAAAKSTATLAGTWRKNALYVILIANLTAAAIAAYYHARYQFSGSLEMASYITASKMAERPIIGDIDFEVSTVAGYLNTPIFYISNGKQETFIRWNEERTSGNTMNPQQFIAAVAKATNQAPLLLLSYPCKLENFRLVKQTAPSIVKTEELFLYEQQ